MIGSLPPRAPPASRAGRHAFVSAALVALVVAGTLFLLRTRTTLDLPLAAGICAALGLLRAAFAGWLVQAREWRRRRLRLALERMEQNRHDLEAQIEVLDAALEETEPEPEAQADELAAARERDERWSRSIQAALLPARPPVLPGYHMDALYLPCGALGGDFYDFRVFEDGRILVTLGDVSGKGAAGAIVMAMVQTLFRQNADVASGPADLLARVNGGFAGALGKGIFVTALAAFVDPVRHTLTLAGAGHHPVMLFNVRKRVSSLVQAKGAALGLMSGADFRESLVETRIDLERGDVLLFYTDGASEGSDSLMTDTGEDRLRAAAASAVLDGLDGALGRIRSDLYMTAAPRDDSTLLLLARLVGPGRPHLSRMSPARTSEDLTA